MVGFIYCMIRESWDEIRRKDHSENGDLFLELGNRLKRRYSSIEVYVQHPLH